MSEIQLSTLDTQHLDRDLSISKLHLKGLSQRDIASQLDVSQPTISAILSKQHIKSVVERAVSSMILRAPEVVQRLFQHIHDKDDKTISMKAITEYNKVIGISQSHASIVVQNMYVDARQQTVSADLVQLLGQGMDTLTDDDVIDLTEDSDT